MAYAVSDILTDSMVLSMPAPAVWQLQMSTRQKVAISGTFLLGALVVVSGIVRTVFSFRAAKTPQYDATYYAAPAVYWSLTETSLAVVSACLPTLLPIFRGFSLKSLLHSLRSKLSLHSISKIRSFGRQNSPGSESTSSVAGYTAKYDAGAYNSISQRNRSNQGTEEFEMVQSPAKARTQWEG